MPKPKIRPVSPDEVKISREHGTAVFTYADSSTGGGMHLKIGPEVAVGVAAMAKSRVVPINKKTLQRAKPSDYYDFNSMVEDRQCKATLCLQTQSHF